MSKSSDTGIKQEKFPSGPPKIRKGLYIQCHFPHTDNLLAVLGFQGPMGNIHVYNSEDSERVLH